MSSSQPIMGVLPWRSVAGALTLLVGFVSVDGAKLRYVGSDVHSEDQHYWRTSAEQSSSVNEAKQDWKYVNVRPNAYMFWWLYFTTAPEGFAQRPLVIWLQGGPGGSSTGYGNFEELGPLDSDLNPRNTTWLSEVSLLFIDNPVGTGYSYVTDDAAYTKTNEEIAKDLVFTLTEFLKLHTEFQDIPLYIFSESYGGKMTAGFGRLLFQTIKLGTLKCNFQGVALGDSWISPIDSVNTWGPYLYATSLVDEEGLSAINVVAKKTQDALDNGQFEEATELWGEAEGVVSGVTNGVNFYNILQWGASSDASTEGRKKKGKKLTAAERILAVYANGDLDALMNGPIRQKLKIIPQDVTWGGQESNVFGNLHEDFMKPVVDVVSDLLTNTTIDVVVYNGQLDLIVDTLGTERWVQKLNWADLPCYNNASRRAFYSPHDPVNVAGFVKTCKHFSFYWIMDAGHMIPADQGNAALVMLKDVVKIKKISY